MSSAPRSLLGLLQAAELRDFLRTLTVLFAVFMPSLASANTRVALVIGNSSYAVSPLQNPSNDADAIAEALGQIGFGTVVKKDLDANGMKAALKEFARAAAGSEIALVFYAGHGMEMGGKNYLIPVDAKLERASDIELEATSLDVVLGQLDGVRGLKLVILDACRNSTFRVAGGTRAVARGLGRIEPEDNTLVAYAARAGTTADDGTGQKHSPFTAALLKHMPTPGLDIRLLLGRVRDEVVAATGGTQTPHVYGSLGGTSVALLPGLSSAGTPPFPQDARPSLPDEAARDYGHASQIGTTEAWNSFLAKHSRGFYADLGREQLAKLTDPATGTENPSSKLESPALKNDIPLEDKDAKKQKIQPKPRRTAEQHIDCCIRSYRAKCRGGWADTCKITRADCAAEYRKKPAPYCDMNL